MAQTTRADLSGAQVQLEHRAPGLGRVRALAPTAGVGVDGVEQPAELEVGERADVGQRPGELGDAVAHPGEPADDPHPVGPEGVEVEGAVGADELERGEVARPDEVVDLVPALVEDAEHVEPPEDVAPAVAAGHADVLADREGHRPSGALELLGDLQAARRPADDEDAAAGQPVRVAVLQRR